MVLGSVTACFRIMVKPLKITIRPLKPQMARQISISSRTVPNAFTKWLSMKIRLQILTKLFLKIQKIHKPSTSKA